MLDSKRFDVALVPELIFKKAVADSGRNLKNYQTKLMLAQPFGIYVSKGFIAQHPGILEKVNAAIRKVIHE